MACGRIGITCTSLISLIITIFYVMIAFCDCAEGYVSSWYVVVAWLVLVVPQLAANNVLVTSRDDVEFSLVVSSADVKLYIGTLIFVFGLLYSLVLTDDYTYILVLFIGGLAGVMLSDNVNVSHDTCSTQQKKESTES